MKRILISTLAILMAGIAAVTVSATSPDTASAADNLAPKCGGGTYQLTSSEYIVFKKQNDIRRNNNKRALCVHPALQQAARGYAQKMLNEDIFTHGNVEARLDRVNYNWRTYGENIGNGLAPLGMVNAWMRSSGHRANILNGNFHEVGVGVKYGKYKGNSNYPMYVVDFGTRR